jgi:hypothetical protein
MYFLTGIPDAYAFPQDRFLIWATSTSCIERLRTMPLSGRQGVKKWGRGLWRPIHSWGLFEVSASLTAWKAMLMMFDSTEHKRNHNIDFQAFSASPARLVHLARSVGESES